MKLKLFYPALLLILFISANFTFAQEIENEDKTLSPYFFVKSEDSDLDQLPLKSTKVDVNISGVIAAVNVRQTYVNAGKKTIEAIYIFPASTRAAVHAMEMTIGERTLKAIIQEKQKARETYEKAKEEGKTASLLEQQRPNVFQMNVANILPGDTIHVDLHYTEMLIPEDGIYEFVYPTVVGPRYAGETPSDAIADSKWVENPYTEEGEKPTYTFNITSSLQTGIPVKDIRCTTHEVNVNFDGQDKAVCVLNPKEKFGGNRDYILQYRLRDDKIQTGVLLLEGEEENFFLTMVQPPDRPKSSDIPPREYVFIVDVSGSMNGFPLNVAKKTMNNLLSNLRPEDRFNVMTFESSADVLAPKSLPVNDQNIKKGINFIDKNHGYGGTNMLNAMKKAFDLVGTEDYSRTFVILTDGYVSVERQVFDLIKTRMSDANFFAFGIGSSVNRYIIEGIAHVGMGQPFVITNRNEAAVKAEKFRKYIQTPVLTNLKVKFNNFDTYDVIPESYPDVFAERPVLIFGKWKGKPKGNINITGLSGNKNHTQTIAIKGSADKLNNESLKYLWARYKIQLLDDYMQVTNDKDLEKQVTELGIKYNLLTRFTSFVAVDSLNRADESAATIKQPLPLPDGVSNYAVGAAAVSEVKVKRSRPKIIKNEDEADEAIFTFVEKMPEFPGGEAAIKKYIAKNLQYPEKARENNIQGTVYIQFTIDEKGKMIDIKIARGVDNILNKEAIRIIKKMAKEKRWKPGEQRGKPVKVKYTVPVKFSLK